MILDNKYKYHLNIIIMIMPALILYTLLIVYPVGNTVIRSFFSWNGISGVPQKFSGLKNYSKLFMDKDFWIAMRNAMLFIIGSFIIELPISFFLALIINEQIIGKKVFKFAFFLPVILPITAVGLMWMFLLHPTGVVNQVLSTLGLGILAKGWLAQMDTAIYAVIVVNMWIYAGYNMLIFSSGMTNISTDIYEAANIDGASYWQSLWKITIPLLKSSLLVFSILAVTGSLRAFDLVYVMTGGGPNGSSHMPATLLYNEAFKYSHFGLANAIGTIILVLGILFSWIASKKDTKND